jgi:hypothetical protein
MEDARFNIASTEKWRERLASGEQKPRVENEAQIAERVCIYERQLLATLILLKEGEPK